jgi:hypothetical protein
MWFLNSKVLLTKDNLAKRNWNGCQKCCFIMNQKLFITYSYRALLLELFGVSYTVTFNIPPPANITICLVIG